MFIFNPVTVTRGHPYRLFVPFERNNTRKTFFVHRDVKPCNNLPADVVDFSTLNRFKRSLHKVDFSFYYNTVTIIYFLPFYICIYCFTLPMLYVLVFSGSCQCSSLLSCINVCFMFQRVFTFV